jgi:hypothetical protein
MQFRLTYEPVYGPGNAVSLEFEKDRIIFDENTIFQSADLIEVNTDIDGEVFVSLFVGDPVALPPGPNFDQVVFYLPIKINGVQGNVINLNAEDVEVITATSPGSALPFEVSNEYAQIAAGDITLTVQAELKVLYAEALDDEHVLVQFSDLLQSKGVPDDYDDISPALNALSVESGYESLEFTGYDQSAVILETDPQNAGTVYILTVDTAGTIMSNVQGAISGDYSKALFTGFETGISEVQLQSIDVNSSTEVVLRFSGPVDPGTVTPINIGIQTLLPTPSGLTITNVEMNGNNQVTLSTSQQIPDANYFVMLNGVEDESGVELGNNRVLNFFGYSTPSVTVSSVSPASLTNEVEQVVVILGQNLDTVVEARLGRDTVQITEQSEGALSLIVPAGFDTGVYELSLVSATGQITTLADALVVSTPVQPMRVVSEESRAIPNRVNPDGTTEITFWVQVEDPVDIGSIDSVTIDLEQIGGDRAQEMDKDTGLQPQYKQYYTYTTTVHPNTPTKSAPYQLAVEVKKGSEVARGTVQLYVTADVLGSVAPSIAQAYINPTTVAPDGETPVKITAKVTDPDGADTITSVVADLGPLGAGFALLDRIDSPGAASEQVTGWYESSDFTIPRTTQEGNYTISVTAEDATGETSSATINLNVSRSLTGPTIDNQRSYIGPRRSVPNDNKTPFAIHAMVTDPDGVADIDTVIAYFGTIGLPPVTLLRDPSASQVGQTALYSSPEMTIPTTSPLGIHEVEIIATDSKGGTASLIIQLDVTYKDVIGDAPILFDDKAYTVPRAAVNDGRTRITLYAFVRDDDDDLESVVVNLSNIGQVGEELPPDLGAVAVAPMAAEGGACPTGSNVIVCMQPSFKEGRDGQWFILPDVTISSSTVPSSEPYSVEVIATDSGSKVDRGVIPVFVQSSAGFIDDQNPPEIITAVATGLNTVEVLFNEAISAPTITPASSAFTITDKDDISKTLNILSSTINATGNVVTLTTADQVEGKTYVLNANTKVTDMVGVAIVPGQRSQAFFTGFKASPKVPIVDYIAALDPNTIEIEFQNELRPTSVNVGVSRSDFNIKITESDTGIALAVNSVQFGGTGKTLVVITDPQKSETRYRVQIEDIASSAGNALTGPIGKTFKSVSISAIRTQVVGMQADLNGDGKVDFIDFTMFSAVYGQVFSAEELPVSDYDQGLSPIPPTPDSTVPHTSPIN